MSVPKRPERICTGMVAYVYPSYANSSVIFPSIWKCTRNDLLCAGESVHGEVLGILFRVFHEHEWTPPKKFHYFLMSLLFIWFIIRVYDNRQSSLELLRNERINLWNLRSNNVNIREFYSFKRFFLLSGYKYNRLAETNLCSWATGRVATGAKSEMERLLQKRWTSASRRWRCSGRSCWSCSAGIRYYLALPIYFVVLIPGSQGRSSFD